MQDDRYDLFVVYAEPDGPWVECFLLDAFSQAGLKTISEAAFTLGAPRLKEIERAVRQSDSVLLVISAAFLLDPLAGIIDLLAQSYGLETSSWPVIPLLIEPAALPTRLGFLVGVDATDPATREEVVRDLCDRLKHPLAAPPAHPPCPYPGMVAFDEDQARYFFGREEETSELVERLRDHAFLAVIGGSGSGKSSLVRAGLIPELRKHGPFGKQQGSGVQGDWSVAVFRPGPAPIEALASAVGGRVDLEHFGPYNGPPFLLVVDQFEELFTLKPGDASKFQQSLGSLAAVAGIYIVITVRADFYVDLMHSPLWPEIQAHRYEVLALTTDGLHQAIRRPAESVGVLVEATLIERLSDDAANEPGALPLLQQTMVLLWEHLERRLLPLRAYESLVLTYRQYRPSATSRTGLEVAIARHADLTYEMMSPSQQLIARRTLLRLIQFGEGRADTRRQQSVEHLRSSGDGEEDFEKVLEILAERRLITLSADGQQEREPAHPTMEIERRVDIAHEALISGWPTLQTWLQQRRSAELVRRNLDGKVAEWERLDRKGGLLDAAELREAKAWIAGPDAKELGFDDRLPALILASENTLRRAALFRGGLVAAIVLVLLGSALVYALNQRSAAQREQAVAQRERDLRQEAQNQLARSRSRQLAAQAQYEIGRGRSELALLLSIGATRNITETSESATALRQGLDAWRGSALLAGHSKRATKTLFSPNGQYLASASDDGTVRVWQMHGPRQVIVLRGHEGIVTDIVFTPDSASLIAGGRDNVVIQWQVESGQVLHKWKAAAAVTALDVGDGGKLLAAGEDGGAVQLWDLTTGEAAPFAPYPGGHGGIQDLAFRPGSTLLAMASGDASVGLWDPPSGGTAVLGGFARAVDEVLFAPDGGLLLARGGNALRGWDLNGLVALNLSNADQPALLQDIDISPNDRYLAAASQDGSARVWDLSRPGSNPTPLLGHRQPVWTIRFSPDGSTIATASWDGTARMWSLSGELLATLAGPTGNLWVSSFSPDGTWFATPEETGLVWLWRAQPGGDRFRVNTGLVPAIALAERSGKLLVAGGSGLTAVSTGEPAALSILDGAQANTAMAASKDGTLVAVGAPDGSIRLIDGGNGAMLSSWAAHAGRVRALLFMSDEVHLASGAEDGSVKVWDLRRLGTTQPFATLADHTNDVTALAQGNEAGVLASAGSDGTIRLWQWQEGREASRIDAKAPLLSLAMSADGRHLLAGGYDGFVALYDAASPGEPFKQSNAVIPKHDQTVRSVALSADGGLAATGDESGTLRLWYVREAGDPGNVSMEIAAGHWVTAVTFSNDARTVYSLTDDGILEARPASTQEALALACERVTRDLTEQEWAEFLPEIEHREGSGVCETTGGQTWEDAARLDPPMAAPPARLAVSDLLPSILYFDAVPGTTVRVGTSVQLRWNTAGAEKVYLVHGDSREGVASPGGTPVALEADEVYRLEATNKAGTRSAELRLRVGRP